MGERVIPRVRRKSDIPRGLRPGARARWGSHIQWTPARENARYVGPVFAVDSYLAQRISENKVVIHRRDEIDYGTTKRLQRRAQSNRLNDVTLAIYYIDGRRLAFLHEVPRPPVSARRASSPRSKGARSRSIAKKRAREALTVAASVSAGLVLASCSSHRLITPDGSHRVQVNTPESLSKYQDLVAREDAIALERSELQRKVDELSAQIAELRSGMQGSRKVPTAGPLPAHKPLQVVPQIEASPPQSFTPAQPAATPNSETVVVGADRVVFRVSHSTGHTRFEPSASLEETLLRAAREGKTILIRGRTDSETIDDTETRIALVRALRARDYLVSNSIDPAKIRVWYRAAGDFIADNATPEGRAVNRRVEIEVRGLDTAAFAPRVADQRLSRNP